MQSVGPRDAKILIVGEAPGDTETQLGKPFMGSAGQELTKMLLDAGLRRQDCYLTYAFMEQPPKNKIEEWQVKKKELPSSYSLPAMSRGNYLSPSKVHHIDRLWKEIETVKPNVIVALGAVALWALTYETSISALRGAIIQSRGYKILPTFHPAYILRVWSDRLVLVADLMKAKTHSDSPTFQRPVRNLLITPIPGEVEQFYREHLASARLISVDIETERQQITSISFAPRKDLGLVIPFVNREKSDKSQYSFSDELRCWRVVRAVLSGEAHLLFQNGAYDCQYLLRYGIDIRNFFEDSMILHHSLLPEMQKGLGFLGSLYLDEPAWKIMRKAKKEAVKKDE